MSNKGNTHSIEARNKIGIANKKDRTLIDEGVNDYIKRLTKDKFPSLTDAALHAGISEKRLILYESTTDENSNIRLALDEIRDRQKSFLMSNGLNKKIDSRLTGLLLEANHNLRSKEPNLSQTNIFNVPPDILAEAISLSRINKK